VTEFQGQNASESSRPLNERTGGREPQRPQCSRRARPDLQEDSEEADNLATNPKANGDLIMEMNAKLNGRIAQEVGDDNGHFIPIRNGKWFFPPKSER
jgi:hypothetical protein